MIWTRLDWFELFGCWEVEAERCRNGERERVFYYFATQPAAIRFLVDTDYGENLEQ